MRPIKLKVKTKTQEYPIIIGSNLMSNISKVIKDNSLSFKQCLLIIDKNISKKILLKLKKSLIKRNVYVYVYFLKANEINKNINTVNKILEILLNKNLDVLSICVGFKSSNDILSDKAFLKDSFPDIARFVILLIFLL